MSPTRRSGPELPPETAETGFAATVSNIMPRAADTDQPLAPHLGLVARFETSEGRHTRRAYFSLPAAERAVRAAQQRGVHATLTVCNLVPVREVALEPEAVAR